MDECDTATAYNNLGCCFMKLYRIQEAYNYFRLSEAIYEANLGTYHERTLTVKFLIGNL
jgi:hypothetical protein